MATGFGLVALPLLLVAGAILFFGQRAGSALGVWTGTLLVGLPFLLLGTNVASGKFSEVSRVLWKAQGGRFQEPHLTELARAMDRGDTAKVRVLATTPGLDFRARDRHGQTILDYAVGRAMYGQATNVEAVRVLIEAGAPIRDGSASANPHLLEAVFSNGDSASLEVLELLLKAGADPNTRSQYDNRPLVFDVNLTTPKLELLARYGADLQVLDVREDRKAWTTLMNAAYMQQWDQAIFFLEHGVPAEYRAPDGNTVATILDDVAAREKASGGVLGEGYERLKTALRANEVGGR